MSDTKNLTREIKRSLERRAVSFVHIPLASIPADLLTRDVTGDDWSALVRKRTCRPQYRQDNGKANSQPRRNHPLPLFPLTKLASAYVQGPTLARLDLSTVCQSAASTGHLTRPKTPAARRPVAWPAFARRYPLRLSRQSQTALQPCPSEKFFRISTELFSLMKLNQRGQGFSFARRLDAYGKRF
jgi:hypothetical protein